MGRTVVSSIACAVLVLLLFAGSASAQMGAIAGKAVDEDGKPIANAVIRIVRNDIKGQYQTKTNNRGEFFHAGLPSGRSTNYTVTLIVNDREVDSKMNIVVSIGDQARADFDLGAKKKQEAALAAGELTADQTRGMSAEQKEQLERAMKERAAALAKNKALSDAFNAGMEAMKANQFAVAVEQFVKASEADPKQSAVWGQLAEAYTQFAQTKTGQEQQDALTKALDAYVKALELKPDDAGLHNNYALALVRAKKLPEAQAELEKAAALDVPGAGKYYYNMGAVMMNTGQLDAAGEAFKKAISLSPDYAPAQFQYGLYLLGKAQIAPDGKIQPPPGTAEALQTYLKLEPSGPNADQAKTILQSLNESIETTYTNPDAKKTTKKSGKK